MGKVFKNGNSLAVTVPKAYANQLSIRSGSSVEWEKTRDGLTLVPKKIVKATGVDAKFMEMVDDFMKKHKNVLQELSDR